MTRYSRPSRVVKIFSLVVLWAAIHTCARAEDPIGSVKSVVGEATITTKGNRAKAQIGSPLFTGSQLKTLASATLAVVFKDNTSMSFGPNTELVVDEYLFNPAQGKLKLGTKLVRGSMNYLSGSIAKLNPDGVTVNTPAGSIGVRGTQFVVVVEEE